MPYYYIEKNDDSETLKHTILFSIAGATLVLIVKYIADSQIDSISALVSILMGSITAFATLSYKTFKARAEFLETHRELYKETIEHIPHNNLIRTTYKWLIDNHNGLPLALNSFITQTTQTYSPKGGLIFIEIHDKNYIEILEKCLDNSSDSFQATLSGKYNVEWFFNDNDPNFSSRKRLEYLKVVNDKERINIKQRLMIFSYKEFENSMNYLKRHEDRKNIFFAYNNKIDLYFVNKDHLMLNDDYPTNVMMAIHDDYALFDDKFILRKNSMYELALYFGNGDDCIGGFRGIFDESKWNRNKDLFWDKRKINEVFELELEDHLLGNV